MPTLASTPTKEKKKVGVCQGGTPTPSLRRVPVKPLGEHNRSRTHSPAPGKRTPARGQQKAVDLTRRFVDSAGHGPATGADFRSPRGCSNSMGRERKGSGMMASKSRLRGSEDTPPVKKAITFGKEKSSVRKLPKQKDLISEHSALDGTKGLSSLATPLSNVERHGGTWEVPMAKIIGLRGKGATGSNHGKASLVETSGARSGTHEKLAMETGHRSFGAREDAPCRLAFDAIEMSPQVAKLVGSQSSRVQGWDNERGADGMLLPLPCNSPEVCNRGSAMEGEGLPWELQEDAVAQEWFHSRDMGLCDRNGTSKTPEPQPSKSPELSRRAISGVGALLEGAAVEREVANQQTPSPQPTSSPEFLKRGSVPPSSTGGCFGAGPLMGPEGMRSVKDRRKCKPRGILTIEGEFLLSAEDFVPENVQVKEAISVPALASVEWMVADAAEDVQVKEEATSFPELASVEWMVVEGYDDIPEPLDQAMTVSGHRRCKSAAESGSDHLFWKKGLLYEWNYPSACVDLCL